MSALPEAPFDIGQTFWLPGQATEQVMVECPICAGNKSVTVILGSGEHVTVNCDGCGLGYESASGVIKEYRHTPAAYQFVVAAVERYAPGEWYLRSTDGRNAYFSELRHTETSALAESAEKIAALEEQNMMYRAHKKKGLSKLAWTIRYHREQIRDAERQLEWHSQRVTPLEAKQKGDAA